jgi:hypothetical protein
MASKIRMARRKISKQEEEQEMEAEEEEEHISARPNHCIQRGQERDDGGRGGRGLRRWRWRQVSERGVRVEQRERRSRVSSSHSFQQGLALTSST